MSAGYEMSREPVRAAFLDRDGTIVIEKDYLADPAQVVLIDGTVEALRILAAAGYKLVVVTNQSGIARGLYSLDDYRAVEQEVERRLSRHGVEFEAVLFCPHHPDYTGVCECRKPALGMYREAERNLGIDLVRSVYIGDRVKDVLPGLELGGRAILVRTGYGSDVADELPPGVETAADLLDAAYKIVGKTRTTLGFFEGSEA